MSASRVVANNKHHGTYGTQGFHKPLMKQQSWVVDGHRFRILTSVPR